MPCVTECWTKGEAVYAIGAAEYAVGNPGRLGDADIYVGAAEYADIAGAPEYAGNAGVLGDAYMLRLISNSRWETNCGVRGKIYVFLDYPNG